MSTQDKTKTITATSIVAGTKVGGKLHQARLLANHETRVELVGVQQSRTITQGVGHADRKNVVVSSIEGGRWPVVRKRIPAWRGSPPIPRLSRPREQQRSRQENTGEAGACPPCPASSRRHGRSCPVP